MDRADPACRPPDIRDRGGQAAGSMLDTLGMGPSPAIQPPFVVPGSARAS